MRQFRALPHPAPLLLVALLLVALALTAACGGSRRAPAATSDLSATSTAAPSAGTSTPTAEPTASTGATAAEMSAPSAEPSASTGGVAAGTSAPTAEPTASTGATPRAALPLIEFVRADGTAMRLPLEVPPRNEYVIGLSGRQTLDERGMLFHYPGGEQRVSFWMKNTHFDLAIAFVSADFRIVEIRALEAESLEIIQPQAVHEYAVEAPAGWYARHGIAVGDRARFLFQLRDAEGNVE